MAESGVTECGLGQMLGSIKKMESTDKWGFILDVNGNVGTFMKYKSCYLPAFEWVKDEKLKPSEKGMA